MWRVTNEKRISLLDYFAYILSILIFIYLYRTVSGFRLLSIGINKEVSESLGVTIQNIVPSQLTMAIPYVATIIALAIFSKKAKRPRV